MRICNPARIGAVARRGSVIVHSLVVLTALIMIGAATSIFTAPKGFLSPFSALPLQIYAWSDFPKAEFQHGVTPAAIVVLLIILLAMNGIAIYIRNRFSGKQYTGK